MICIHVMSVKLDILRMIKLGLWIKCFYVITWYEYYVWIQLYRNLDKSYEQYTNQFLSSRFSSDVQYIVVYNRTTSQNIDSSINDIFMKTKTCQIKVCEKFVRMDRLLKKIINVIIDFHHPLYRNYLMKLLIKWLLLYVKY